ncbi:MAG: isoleucine--tRNA ligase [Patescibacteria group bacterium]|mgnify:CR=1 FL=1
MPDMHKTHAQEEQDLLEYWAKHRVFERSVDQRSMDRHYTFYDGPPFATGLPHYGHIVGSIMKDVVPRFWTMKGYRVERKWGWDCHGLPIENLVEKEFGLESKKDILAYGIGNFNDRCEATVLTYVAEWKKMIRRLGRWVDMENAYKTMDVEFMESIWWVFAELWKKNKIYEGKKAMHVCPRCETTLSNFEVAQGYLDVTDISVTVAPMLTGGQCAGSRMLVWTTTPWTLPGNVLLAVHPEMTYVRVSFESQTYIVAKALVEKVFAGKEYSTVDEMTGLDLVDSAYEPLFPVYANHKDAFRVVAADFVTDADGTGVVHIAPAYGEDDMNLGVKLGVKGIQHVGMNGQLATEVSEYLEAEGYHVKGIPVKAKGEYSLVDIEVIKYLAHHGTLFAKLKFTHSYPHCWRCDTPLLNFATSSWFVRVAEMRDRLVENNKAITWVPDNMKEGRFGKWLEGARDWAISRSRFWGTPLPVWKCGDESCGHITVIGSVAELRKRSVNPISDTPNLHKHIVDELHFNCEKCESGIMSRIPEVLDCWFESGSMPYAQLHYPFENSDQLAGRFPAQFIAEGQDQTRGWFYTLHVLSTALFDKPAFENVIVNGIVLAEDGKKMSKRLKNYPDPAEVIEKYSADAVRFYLMSTPVVKAENLRFTESGVDEVSKKFITILRNVLSFYQLYQEHDTFEPAVPRHVLDRWILSRLNETLESETQSLEQYELSDATRGLQSFVTDLSIWYLRRSRDRMKDAGADRAEALATLRTVLETFSKMIAPFMPFLAEYVYLAVTRGADDRSVHLELWPEVQPIEQSILKEMGEARAIVSRVMEARDSSGRAVKQALGSMTIATPSGEIDENILTVILDEVNVRKAVVMQGEELMVDVDTNLTPELIRDGIAREVTRRVNGMRKDGGLTIADRIALTIDSSSDEVKTMFAEHGDAIKADTLSSTIEFGSISEGATSVSFRVAEQDVTIGIVKT